MEGFKQLSTTMVWKLKKEWGIDEPINKDDINFLYYGLVNNTTGNISTFVCFHPKNGQLFFKLHTKGNADEYEKSLCFLFKKASIFKMNSIYCFSTKKYPKLYLKMGFNKQFSAIHSKDILIKHLIF